MNQYRKIIKDVYAELKNNHMLLEDIKEMLNILMEAEQRKREENFWQTKKTNEYEKLLLNNLSSRISILEEESEKYQRKND